MTTTLPLPRDLQNCPGKVRFETRARAKARANKIRTTGGDAMQVYQCTSCSGWHLGHPNGRGTGLRNADHARQARARIQIRPVRNQQEPTDVKPPNFAGRQACLGDNTFNDGKASDAKRATCNRCPCLPECFAWSIQFEPFGFWAGMAPAERARIRSKYAVRAAFDSSGTPRTVEDR